MANNRAMERGFKGEIDYLRMASGTLKNAETTIDELYDWEFNGPFLKDINGKPRTDSRQSAGAKIY